MRTRSPRSPDFPVTCERLCAGSFALFLLGAPLLLLSLPIPLIIINGGNHKQINIISLGSSSRNYLLSSLHADPFSKHTQRDRGRLRGPPKDEFNFFSRKLNTVRSDGQIMGHLGSNFQCLVLLPSTHNYSERPQESHSDAGWMPLWSTAIHSVCRMSRVFCY